MTGNVILKHEGCCEDFINILLNNDYTVTISPFYKKIGNELYATKFIDITFTKEERDERN